MLSVFWYIICHLVLFLLFTSNFLNKSVSALGNKTDHFALLKFKESISSDPFGVLNSWNSSTHFCMWHGVTCGHKHQRVTQIKLKGYKLQGSISPHVGNLSFLRVLYLDDNSFHANVPRELGNLFRLHILRKLIIIIFSIAFLLLLSFVLTIIIYQIMRKRQRKASVDSTIEQLPKVSYQELHHATDGFSVGNLVGTGGIGFVYKGRLNLEESVVAVQVLNLQKKGAHKSFISECNVFRNIRHINLVKIVTCCSSVDHKCNDFKAIVFEYMTNGSLEEWLHHNAEQQRTLKFEKILEIVSGIASALHYLHYECEKPIVHCDLKPSNVLLDDDMIAHVNDFGLARLVSTIDGKSNNQTSSMGIKGTIGYTPPEYGMDSQLSREGDMYSFGILLLEMLTGRRPTDEMFKDGHNVHNYANIAFPNNILEIVDATLLLEENDHVGVTTEVASDLYRNVERFLSSLLKIGLSYSKESPRERINIKEVIAELNKISKALAD